MPAHVLVALKNSLAQWQDCMVDWLVGNRMKMIVRGGGAGVHRVHITWNVQEIKNLGMDWNGLEIGLEHSVEH